MENNRTGDNGYAPGARNITGAAGESGVESFIEKQQELAREDLLREFGHDETLRLWVEHRIEKTITNTGEEMQRLAEGERLRSVNEDDYVQKIFEEVQKMPLVGVHPHYRAGAEHGYNRAIHTLKKHITNVTGVE